MAVSPPRPTNGPLLREASPGTASRCDDLIACSPAMVEALYLADAFAPCDRTIVLHGETGTGKSLLARLIHVLSGRVGGFHAISVGTLTPSLAEAELFGHERGAFTDAKTARVGLLGESGGGTLLLDDMQGAPAWLQRKLFDAMDRRVYRVLGSDRVLAIACRFIVSLNEDPDTLVRQGVLIKDLRYRFEELWIRMAALRERREEIPLLAARALKRCHQDLSPDGPSQLSDAALAVLCQGDYPGNVRQLEKAVERGYLVARKAGRDMIETSDLPPDFCPPLIFPSRGTLADRIAAAQRAVERTGGNIAAAARLVGRSRNTIQALIRRRIVPR